MMLGTLRANLVAVFAFAAAAFALHLATSSIAQNRSRQDAKAISLQANLQTRALATPHDTIAS